MPAFKATSLNSTDIVVGPSDNLHQAILDAGSTPIRLRAGVYRGGYKLQQGTQLLAYPGEQPLMTGAEPLDASTWTKNGEAYSIPWDIPFYQHPSKQVGLGDAGLRHRAAMQPHMIIVDGQPLQTVYRTEDLMPGTMYLEGASDAPKSIWVRFMDDRPPEEFDVQVARYQQVLSSNMIDLKEVVLEGLTFRFCANTAYQGMVSFPEKAEGWKLTNLDLQWSNTEGIHIMGTGHHIQGLITSNHGQNGLSTRQMNGCTLEDIETSFNNWKGFDPKWDAGNKLRNSNKNVLRRIKAVGNPIWWDIENQGNWMEDFEILNSICWGLMVEYHSSNNSFINGVIKGTRLYNNEPDTGSGLRIQSSITGCEFANIHLEDNRGGAVYYKKTEERHGEMNYSGLNTFDNITQKNNGREGKWLIEGKVDTMPDRYRNMEEPGFEVRRK
ncbi:MAG: hypothetical protein AB8G77_12245 [Rhodothermales bacterium]